MAKEEVQGKADALVATIFNVVVVCFEDGKKQPVELRSAKKPLSFACGKPSVGCCGGKAPEWKVTVKTVEKGKQAAKLWVVKGWSIRSINGTEVTGLEHANKLLSEASAALSDKAE